MDKRQWLRENGFPEVGKRGRFSAEHKAALAKAGIKDDPRPAKVYTPTVQQTSGISAEITPRYPHGTRFMHIDARGKKHYVSDAVACMNCSYSLGYCGCRQPRAIVKGFGYVPVEVS